MFAPQRYTLVSKHFWRKEYGVVVPSGQKVWTARLHGKYIDLRTANGIHVATAKRHSFSSQVDMHWLFTGTAMKLAKAGSRSSKPQHLYYRGQTVTWQKVGRPRNTWNLYDGRGCLLATFAAKTWGWGKSGTYDVFVPNLNQEMMELILLLGMSELERILSDSAACG